MICLSAYSCTDKFVKCTDKTERKSDYWGGGGGSFPPAHPPPPPPPPSVLRKNVKKAINQNIRFYCSFQCCCYSFSTKSLGNKSKLRISCLYTVDMKTLRWFCSPTDPGPPRMYKELFFIVQYWTQWAPIPVDKVTYLFNLEEKIWKNNFEKTVKLKEKKFVFQYFQNLLLYRFHFLHNYQKTTVFLFVKVKMETVLTQY